MIHAHDHSVRFIANATDHTYRQGDPLERSTGIRLGSLAKIGAAGFVGLAGLASIVIALGSAAQ